MNIALFGFGTVGKQTALYLLNKKNILKTRTTEKLVLKAIFTRSPKKIKDTNINPHLIHTQWKHIVEDPNIDCIIELLGGITLPYDIITHALKNKKNVITANKALLAHRGKQLLQLASKNNSTITFEASCGGGIPIIRVLTDGLISNTISAVYGVLNGTCNFILTEMKHKKISFDAALCNAQKLGLTEADPTLDIGGFDSGHKIAIMSTLSFNTSIDIKKMPITGIKNVENIDIMFAKQLGYTMKLIAAAIKTGNKVSVWVHPALLIQEHPMSNTEGCFNAISVLSSEAGHTFYYGRGAGGKATNSAIISDAISLANGSAQNITKSICMCHDKNTKKNQTHIQSNMDNNNTETYIRLNVKDEAGVLTNITKIFKEYKISIARVLQEDFFHTPKSASKSVKNVPRVALIIITHTTQWYKVKTACKKIANLKPVQSAPVVYPIIPPPDDTQNND